MLTAVCRKGRRVLPESEGTCLWEAGWTRWGFEGDSGLGHKCRGQEGPLQ